MLTTFKPKNVGLFKKEKVHELIWDLCIFGKLWNLICELKQCMCDLNLKAQLCVSLDRLLMIHCVNEAYWEGCLFRIDPSPVATGRLIDLSARAPPLLSF